MHAASASFDPSASPSTLTRVCRLAEGGMGRVDLAVRHEGTFQRLYAIKRLHPHLASDPEFRAMFLEEARIAGMLRHPNVVGVLDVGEDQHGPFLVMDYVDGLPLGNLIRLSHAAGEQMPVQVCVRIALEVARGLHAAHELSAAGVSLGLVHRDLSPQNVLVGFDGAARITDFGIAKALGRSTRTATGVIKGKMSYMAPEQLRMEEPDRRCDLFALGVMTFEMLSGEPMVEGTQEERARSTLLDPPPDIGELRADVPDELVRLLFELLAKDRAERPSDAREVGHRLEGILATLLASDEPLDVVDYVALVAGQARLEQERVIQQALLGVSRVPRPHERARRAAMMLYAAALLALVAVGAAVLAIAWPRGEAPGAKTSPSAVEAAGLDGTPASPRTTEVPAPPLGASEPAGAAASARPSPPEGTGRPRAKARGPRRGSGRLPDWVDFEQ